MSAQQSISYHQLFPWLNVFRAIGLAVSFRQLLVAAGAVCAVGIGQMVFDWVSPRNSEERNTEKLAIAQVLDPVIEVHIRLLGSPHFTLTSEQAAGAARPWDEVIRELVEALNPEDGIGSRLIAIGRCLWSLAAWSFFGLILCRLAARRIALDEEGSFRASVQFGASRFRNAVVAPLIPTGAAVMLIVVAIVAAFPGRIPWIGPLFVMIASPLVLGSSLVAAFLIVATAIGWPLMVAAVAYDDCDGFGGLSRSYSLWSGRPWQFVWYGLVAGLAGMIAVFLLGWLSSCTLQVAAFAFQSGVGGGTEGRGMAESTWTGKFLFEFIVGAYGISYFWTSTTIVYSLLRQSVDRVPASVLAPDDDERPARDPLPVVGMPAVGQDG